MFTFPVAYLNSNDGTSILAFGEGNKLITGDSEALEKIDQFVEEHRGSYIFSALSYDLKNQVENLSSLNQDHHAFPSSIFWVPASVVRMENGAFTFVQGIEDEKSLAFLEYFFKKESADQFDAFPYLLEPRISRKTYLRNVRLLQEEIQNGNIYEINYCQEFFAENVEINDSLGAYFKLNRITEAPYSGFLSIDDFDVFCGSPERFLRKQGKKLWSSPIKGTHRRGANTEEDEAFKKALLNDPKERSENVMIVDLVRNDLSRIAEKNSVEVEELFGIHTFRTVHQMISTISCQLRPETSFKDILQATFPMGSMTGAPKISAMELIEKHEDFKRGIYSGSIGFIDPNGDFDFNVIIRTLIYNRRKKYLSCPVGSAITIQSSPEKEYEECQTKIQGILDQMHAID